MNNGAENSPLGTGLPATRGDRLRQRITRPWHSRFNPLASNPSYASVDLTDLSQIRAQQSDRRLLLSSSAEFNNSGISTFSAADTVDSNGPSNFIPPKEFHRKTHFLAINFGIWRGFVMLAFVFVALVLFIIIPTYYITRGWESIYATDDPPFAYNCYGTGNGWTFVGINLVVAKNLKYGPVKGLDLAWNWVAGRGLQGLLSLLAYRVFSDALLRAAELTPLSYELYASIALYSNRFEVMWQLLLGLARHGGWQVKAIFMHLIISTIYLLVFPSLMDGCSGYDAAQTANFKWSNGTIQSANDISILTYPVLYPDGGSIGTISTDIVSITNICRIYPDTGEFPSNFSYTIPVTPDFSYRFPVIVNRVYDSKKHSFNFTESNATKMSSYLDQVKYCGAGDLLTDSRTADPDWYLYNWADTKLNASWWQNFRKSPLESQPEQWKEWGFAPTDNSNFVCDMQTSIYQWGFSYEWLFVTLVANNIWLFGLWILWIECYINSELCKKGRRLGIWRAILDLSEAMKEELGPNTCAYTNGELGETLGHRKPIKYYMIEGGASEPAHIGLSSKQYRRIKLRWGQEYGKDL